MGGKRMGKWGAGERRKANKAEEGGVVWVRVSVGGGGR